MSALVSFGFLVRLVLILGCLGSGAWASSGRRDIQEGRLNLLVYFAYAESDPAAWIPVFDEYSKLMLNATEGALQLGTVQFTRCPELQDQADIWILNDTSGARAHLSGLGRAGLHMTISQVHKSSSGGALGQFGLLHESGHYLWGCYDEYLGYIGNVRQRSASHFCTLDLSNVGCVMDGGTSVFPNNQRTEFCTDAILGLSDTRHNQGIAGIHPNTGQSAVVITDQEYFLGRSCWSQIAASGVGSISNQTSAPSQSAPVHQAVSYDMSRLNGDLALALLIDVSGSMSAEGRLSQAILGAQAGVSLLRAEESLSIVAFSDTPQVVFAQQTLTPSARSNANAALTGLVAGGGTASGLALIAAVNQLASVAGCVEFIVLVTDGVSAPPNLSDPSVLAALAAGGQAVYALAIGSFPDVTALNAIATSSGGAFYSVSDSSEIPGVLADIFSSAGSGTPVSVIAGGQVSPGSTFEAPFSIAERDACLRVSLSHAPGAILDLSLLAPNGSSISAQAPPPGVSVISNPGSLTLTLDDPEPGAWSVRLDDALASQARFDLRVIVEGAELDINTFAKTAQLTYPEPMQLSLSLVAGVPVGAAQVSANVQRPDGSSLATLFFDDGLAVHGDAQAGDGVYSTLFARYVGDGAYVFDILIDARGARAASNEECGIYGQGAGEDGQSSFAIEGFQACASHTLLLQGQSGPPLGDRAATLRSHAGLSAPASIDVFASQALPVAGFELALNSSEPLLLEALLLDFPRPGSQPELADGMALHWDRDADGRLDVPSVPLALGQLSADSASISFTQPGGALAWMDAGTAQRFLLTLGEAPPVLASLAAPKLGAAGGFLESWGPRGLQVLRLMLLGLALGLLARAARSRTGSKRPLQPALLLLLALALWVPACGKDSSGSRSTPGGTAGAQEFALTPSGLSLRGAVSGLPASAQGSTLRFDLDLVGP